MRSTALALGIATCLSVMNSAGAQDRSQPNPAPIVRHPASIAPKPPKPQEATPANATTDPIEIDRREEKLLEEKLKGICRGC